MRLFPGGIGNHFRLRSASSMPSNMMLWIFRRSLNAVTRSAS
jgi:hypothetical protein